jgi:hypothetical protein
MMSVPAHLGDMYVFDDRRLRCRSKYFVEGDLVFPAPVKVPASHRTFFGPSFGSKAQVYSPDNDGIRSAIRRMTCKRKPEVPGLHEQLFANQIEFVKTPIVRAWLARMRGRISGILDGLPDPGELRRRWYEQRMPKRGLRLHEANVLHSRGEFSRTRVKMVDYKVKKEELLAPKKKLRAVADLTVGGSTLGGYIMDYIKQAFEEPDYIDGHVSVFVKKAEKRKLLDNFEKLIELDGLSHFVYHSDDSCLSIRCADGVWTGNLDISACDASNGNGVFELMQEMFLVNEMFNDDLKGCFEQLELPFKVQSCDKDHSVVFTHAKHKLLFSGSTLTTLVNNVANSLIRLALLSIFEVTTTVSEIEGVIERAAAMAGFLVKCQRCREASQLQFLKHSPFFVSGEWVIQVNLGTLMRGFGHCSLDLPGRRKEGFRRRARRYVSDVVKSYVHAGDNDLLRAMRKLVVKDSKFVEDKEFASSVTYVPNEVLGMRYGLSAGQLDELFCMFANSGYGDVIHNDVIDTIMSLDYGY